MGPPLSLRNVAANLWLADRPFKLPFIGADIGTRMTVIRLADGSLFLHSPVKLDEGTRRGLDELGPVRAIVAPNRVHHLFVTDYLAAYPQARVYAAPGLPEKRKDLTFSGVLGDDAPAEWRGQIEQLLFRGAPILNEVVFFHLESRTLMLTDLAFNLPADKIVGARWFYWLLGAAGQFGPHRLVRLRAIRDRRAARESVNRIIQWDFDRVIVTHGDVLETGGRERFASAFAFLPQAPA